MARSKSEFKIRKGKKINHINITESEFVEVVPFFETFFDDYFNHFTFTGEFVKKQTIFVNQINVNLANNPFDSVVFRVNLYSSKNNQPDRNILKQPIYVTAKIKSGTVTIDVKKYGIVVEDDFFVAVQWISSSRKETLNFCSGLGGKAFIRSASEDKWFSNESFGVGMYCNISY